MFRHYLPRRFLTKYMSDEGGEYTMDKEEMMDCRAFINIKKGFPGGGMSFKNPELERELESLREQKRKGLGCSKEIEITGWGGTVVSGTLGNFEVKYKGSLTLDAKDDDKWSFNGQMKFKDTYDFNPMPFGAGYRPWPAEAKVRAANRLLPGKPFAITSESVSVRQTSEESETTWAGSGRSRNAGGGGSASAMADVGAGGDVGAVVGGGVGMLGAHLGVVVGGDVGAAGANTPGLKAAMTSQATNRARCD